jgi:hypothetical protein
MRFQTRSHFRDEPINLIISGNDYKYATLSTSIALKQNDLFFKNIHSWSLQFVWQLALIVKKVQPCSNVLVVYSIHAAQYIICVNQVKTEL